MKGHLLLYTELEASLEYVKSQSEKQNGGVGEEVFIGIIDSKIDKWLKSGRIGSSV